MKSVWESRAQRKRDKLNIATDVVLVMAVILLALFLQNGLN